ncbi:MAG: glycosyltransferase family 2 protein [Chloroflexota bacterium]|nr:glycosyltransferase family 2 protein [Chloroflexota bacterium]
MPKLAVVIVNYNTRELLDTCLESVFASQTSFPFHVLVVDNRSSDGSLELVAQKYPQATMISSDRNGGFGYANNLALRWLSGLESLPKSDGNGEALRLAGPADLSQPRSEVPVEGNSKLRFPCDYVLFLNPDTVVPKEAFEETVRFLEERPEVGVVGPKVVKLDGTLDLACRRSFPTPASSFFKLTGLSKVFPNSKLVSKYNLTFLGEDETAEVDSVMGAYMLVRGQPLEQAGLFDERFFMYGEDLDLAFRIKERGGKVYYYPAVHVLHHKGASSRKQSGRSIREFYRAMHIFYRKHYAESRPGIINAVITLGIAVRGTIALLQNALRPTERKRVT